MKLLKPFAYSTLSLKHIDILREDLNILIRKKELTENPTIRGYMKDKNFLVPEKYSWAKSYIILAIGNKHGKVTFNLNGKSFTALIPGQYYEGGPSEGEIGDFLKAEFPNIRIENAAEFVHHKLLSARAGLGNYGKNNISYVKELGSFHSLRAYFTDKEFPTYMLYDLKPMKECEGCDICFHACSTGAIRKEHFLIDAERCIPLFNEIEGDFPSWIPKNAHNALIGCLACQFPCPGNKDYLDSIQELPALTEEETQSVLDCKVTDELIESLSKKLPGYYPAMYKEYLQVFTRNLKALME